MMGRAFALHTADPDLDFGTHMITQTLPGLISEHRVRNATGCSPKIKIKEK